MFLRTAPHSIDYTDSLLVIRQLLSGQLSTGLLPAGQLSKILYENS